MEKHISKFLMCINQEETQHETKQDKAKHQEKSRYCKLCGSFLKKKNTKITRFLQNKVNVLE